jgi:hypothetical protein
MYMWALTQPRATLRACLATGGRCWRRPVSARRSKRRIPKYVHTASERDSSAPTHKHIHTRMHIHGQDRRGRRAKAGRASVHRPGFADGGVSDARLYWTSCTFTTTATRMRTTLCFTSSPCRRLGACPPRRAGFLPPRPRPPTAALRLTLYANRPRTPGHRDRHPGPQTRQMHPQARAQPPAKPPLAAARPTPPPAPPSRAVNDDANGRKRAWAHTSAALRRGVC